MGKRMRFDDLIAAERDDLIRACNFTGRERAVFERRAQGASVIETSMEMHVSEATIKRDSFRVRDKIRREMSRRERARASAESGMQCKNEA